MGGADAGKEDTQVIVDFGDGADGGTRISSGGFLSDGYGGGQSGDLIDIGFFHLAEKLPCVRRERGDIAALPLGVEGVEGQRTLTRSRDSGKTDKPVLGQYQLDVFEIVDSGAANGDLLGFHKS